MGGLNANLLNPLFFSNPLGGAGIGGVGGVGGVGLGANPLMQPNLNLGLGN